MKLTDKRFWKFEAIVLICTSICIFLLLRDYWLWFNFSTFAFYCLFLLGGAIAWKRYKSSQWWKLAGYLFLFTTLLLALVLFEFVWDWHYTGGRPADIPPDEGKYITNHEFVEIIMLLWFIIAPVLSCVISYLAKRLLCKNN